MDMQSWQTGQVLVLRPLAKRLDSASSSEFKNKIVDFIFQGYLHFALDMSEIEFMDSSGLSALLSSIKTLQGRGRLVLFSVGPNLAQLFALTKLDRTVVQIYPDQQSALQSLASDG